MKLSEFRRLVRAEPVRDRDKLLWERHPDADVVAYLFEKIGVHPARLWIVVVEFPDGHPKAWYNGRAYGVAEACSVVMSCRFGSEFTKRAQRFCLLESV